MPLARCEQRPRVASRGAEGALAFQTQVGQLSSKVPLQFVEKKNLQSDVKTLLTCLKEQAGSACSFLVCFNNCGEQSEEAESFLSNCFEDQRVSRKKHRESSPQEAERVDGHILNTLSKPKLPLAFSFASEPGTALYQQTKRFKAVVRKMSTIPVECSPNNANKKWTNKAFTYLSKGL